ncbi:ATP-binding protein [Babesia caballi]|uniref:ATP-binding protein n=1 Tax=Babesia caballi TaxID=5871 RepID=A0AAV4M4Z2_BABCB|nr:ATP-binding protein [Babesia caballi]
MLVPEVTRSTVEQSGKGAVGRQVTRIPSDFLPKLLGEFDVWVIGISKGGSRRSLELTEPLKRTIRNMRAPLLCQRIRARALAIEVRSQGATAKRLIPHPPPLTPPIDVGEGLVVESSRGISWRTF